MAERQKCLADKAVLDEERKRVDVKYATVSKARDEFNKAASARDGAERALERARATLLDDDASAKARQQNLLEQRIKIEAQLLALPLDIQKSVALHAAAVEKMEAAALQHGRDTALYTQCEMELKSREKERGSYSTRLQTLQREIEAATRAVEDATPAAKKATKDAYLKDKTAFDALPLDEDELRTKLETLNTINETMMVNSTDLENYQLTQDTIARLTRELEDKNTQYSLKRESYTACATQWIESVRELVKGIDASFQSQIGKLGIRGGIVLSASPSSIKDAELSIRVAFRAEQTPQQLGKDIHSGGERALTTMMYLIAMQGVTPLPFRVVDEINQGMDTRNERAVMELLLNSAGSSSDTALTGGGGGAAGGAGATGGVAGGSGGPLRRQMFIVSPKLLPDLTHSLAIRSSIVLNGRFLSTDTRGALAIKDHFLEFAVHAKIKKGDMSAAKMLDQGHSEGVLDKHFYRKPEKEDGAAAGGATSGSKRGASKMSGGAAGGSAAKRAKKGKGKAADSEDEEDGYDDFDDEE